jgi:hypothetical protein
VPKELPADPDFVPEIDATLDKFEQELGGLPKWSNAEAPKYLYMNVTDLGKKSPEELSEAAFALNQYALNLQRLINKLRGWERWCIARLDQLEAYYLLSVPQNYGFNERTKMARHNPEPCKKINEYLRKIRMQLDRLYEMPSQIKVMSESVRDIKFAAIRREKEFAYARD